MRGKERTIRAECARVRTNARILVVEDDALRADSMIKSLRNVGYVVDLAESVTEADQMLSRSSYELIILGVDLRDMNGLEVLSKLRQREMNTLVLILSARESVEDRVHGLNVGADDYLIKPFALAELEARIQALLRRGSGTTGALLTFGSLVMDRNARRAWLNNKPITLTSRETLILEFLLLNKSMVVSKDHIIEAVCKPREKMSYAALDVQFTRLRAKLAPAKVRVVSIRGLGYLLAEPDDEEQ